jgi:hypothetical protein
MDRRHRTALDHRCQSLALGGVQLARMARRLAVREPLGAMRVEPQHALRRPGQPAKPCRIIVPACCNPRSHGESRLRHHRFPRASFGQALKESARPRLGIRRPCRRPRYSVSASARRPSTCLTGQTTPDPLVAHFLVRPQGEAFLFADALIRDAVYDTLLKSHRRELHRRAAARFAGCDPVLRPSISTERRMRKRRAPISRPLDCKPPSTVTSWRGF